MTDDYYMMQALKEARKALEEEEVPIGAVVVVNDRIIARGHNMTERLQDPTAHAEMIALTAAFNALGSKYVPDATLYVTVEPCLMCAGAMYWAKLGRIVYGTEDEKNGYRRLLHPAQGPSIQASGPWPFHPKTELIRGICQEECAQLMKDFFRERR